MAIREGLSDQRDLCSNSTPATYYNRAQRTRERSVIIIGTAQIRRIRSSPPQMSNPEQMRPSERKKKNDQLHFISRGSSQRFQSLPKARRRREPGQPKPRRKADLCFSSPSPTSRWVCEPSW